jgi:hypothetical protein
MNNNYNRLLRQLQGLSKRLAILLKDQLEENRAEAQSIAQKIKQLVAQLSRAFSRQQLRKAMGAVAILFGLGAAQNVAAQSFATPLTNPFGLTAAGYISIPTLVDIDADGDLDAFVGSAVAYGLDRLYFQNTGTAASPQFAAPLTNPFGLVGGTYSYNMTFADLDNDGDLDAFSGEYDGDLRYFQNTGTATAPQFGAGVLNPFGLSAVDQVALPTLADLDNDGDFDLMVGEYYGAIRYFQNTGTATVPQFAAAVTNPFGLTSLYQVHIPHLVDLDDDGDFDLLSSEYYGDIKYFQNTGTASNPQFAAAVTNPFNLASTSGVVFITSGDLDNDGDVDVLIGEYYGVMNYFRNTTINIGVGELAGVEFKVYPNPTQDVFRVEATTEAIIKIDVMTLTGKVLDGFEYYGQTISFIDYPAGVYLIKVTAKNGSMGFQKVTKL